MPIRSGKISAIAACTATAAVVHIFIFALRPFAFIVINIASSSSRRRASLVQIHQRPRFIILLPERKPPQTRPAWMSENGVAGRASARHRRQALDG